MDPDSHMDAVRMTWNTWPRTKVESSKCVIPVAASISPLRPHPSIPQLPYPPLRCKSCTSALSPFARVDLHALIWICPFCFQRNHFPPHYNGITESNLPAELYPDLTTINYDITPPKGAHTPPPPPPVYLFVMDTVMIEEELEFAKTAVKRGLEMLPDNAMVGFVSYGTQVQVHELGFENMSKVYVFRGEKEMGKDQVLQQLGLGAVKRTGAMPGQGIVSAGGGIERFLLPASECAYTLEMVSAGIV